MTDKRQIAFLLALIGGLLALGTGVMMGLMLATFAFAAGGQGVGFMAILFGWMLLGGLVSGILLLVAAPKLRRPSEAASGRTLAFVGGGVGILGGNLLAGALGIVAAALLMEEPAPAAPAPVQAR